MRLFIKAYTIQIPDTVAGLTVLAFGTSLPEYLLIHF